MTNNTKKQSWVKSGKEIIQLQLKEVPMLMEPFLPKNGTISLAGSSDLGKSYLLLQLADAIVNGKPDFLGFQLNATTKAVLYLSTEDDAYSLCPRLLNLSKGVTDLAPYENLKIITETKDLLKRLDSLLTSQPSDLVIIDTFSDIFDDDMNQANRVRTFLQQFKELANKHKTLFIFNHHCGKKNDYRPPHKDNLLGSQGFESSMRAVLELRKDFVDPGKRHLCVVKGNYIKEAYKNSSFVLDFTFENGFSNTGMRVEFENLVKPEKVTPVAMAAEKVLALKQQGLSISKITDQLKNEGIPIARSTVGNICKNHPSIQNPLENGMDGQAA